MQNYKKNFKPHQREHILSASPHTAAMIDAGSGAVGDGKVACVVRRRVGKGIQGACAPMAELALREQRGCFR